MNEKKRAVLVKDFTGKARLSRPAERSILGISSRAMISECATLENVSEIILALRLLQIARLTHLNSESANDGHIDEKAFRDNMVLRGSFPHATVNT